MNTREYLDISGSLRIQKYNQENQLVEERFSHNDITLAGRELIAELFNFKSTARKMVSKICVGRSKAVFNPADKALKDKAGEVEIKTIEKVIKKDSSNKDRAVLQITGELAEDKCNGEALQEAGLFTSDDVMYNRVIFDVITKSNQFKLTFFWEIAF